jgi:hypothetical protein
VHAGAVPEREPEPEPAAAPTALVRAPAGAALRLPPGAGNRAIARFVGPAIRKARFRSLIGDEAAEMGQFIFTHTVMDLLYPKVTAAVASEPALAEIFKEYHEALFPAKSRPDWAKADARRAELKDTKFPAELLGPEDARLEVGAQIFEKLWKQYSNPKAGFPDLTPYVNLAHFQALRRWELIACKRTATLIAGRYVAGGGGGGTRSATTAIKPTQLVGSVKTDSSVQAGDLSQGTVATYSTSLAKEVERMKRALDDGWVVHARVLSGVEGGGKSKAEAEHSLIVYGYSGDAFEFYDPDVGGSNIERTGFDRLFYDPKANRLSTAETDADFAVYASSTADPGHRKGFQASGVHRYQVSSIETL